MAIKDSGKLEPGIVESNAFDVNATPSILDALDEIRPFLLKDGGDISLESVKNSTVKVKLHGACADCKVNQMTLKNGVETTIKKYAPEIKEVKSVLPLSQ